MFPAPYFAPRYFAPRYWPKTSGTPVTPVIGARFERQQIAFTGPERQQVTYTGPERQSVAQ